MRDRHGRLFSSLPVAVIFLFAACSTDPGSGGFVEGTEWILRSYADGDSLVIVPETEYADAEFDRRHVSGLSSCNDYDALYRTGTRSLFISQPSVTLMACDEASMAFEQTYLANLDASRFYSVRRETLTIFGAKGATLLVFDAAPRNPLLGTWRVDAYEADGAVVASPEDVRLEVVFGLASIGGFAGCNSFSGTYGTNGNYVRISRIATTSLTCDEAVMAVEEPFLNALQGTSFVDRRDDEMLLTDRNGSMVVTLSRPQPDVAASPSPSDQPAPSATAEPTATPNPTKAPTEAPAPTTAPTVPPTVPPIIVPAVSTCDLLADGTALGAISYPATWSTLAEPPDVACRYFDRDPIEAPSDPSTLSTEIMVATSATPYADAIAQATDAGAWTVRQTVEVTVDGLPATMVEAEATADAGDVPAGTSRLAYFVDYGSAGTVTLFTLGASGDKIYAANAAVLTLMVGASMFTAPNG